MEGKTEKESTTLNKWGTTLVVKDRGGDEQLVLPDVEDKFDIEIDTVKQLKNLLEEGIEEDFKTYSFELVQLNGDLDFDIELEEDEEKENSKTIEDVLEERWAYDEGDFRYEEWYLVKTKKSFYNHFLKSGIQGVKSKGPSEDGKLNSHYVLIHKNSINEFIEQSDYDWHLVPNKQDLAKKILED